MLNDDRSTEEVIKDVAGEDAVKQELGELKFGANASKALVVIGTFLAAVYGLGDTLGIGSPYIDYLKGGLSFLGVITGVTFINRDEKKITQLHSKIGIVKNK
jgi:hypothetical protein